MTAWRRFFCLAAGTAAVAAGVIYAFVVLVDPWNILPLSPPFDRAPVSSNQRFSYPGAGALAGIRQRDLRHLHQPAAASGGARPANSTRASSTWR